MKFSKKTKVLIDIAFISFLSLATRVMAATTEDDVLAPLFKIEGVARKAVISLFIIAALGAGVALAMSGTDSVKRNQAKEAGFSVAGGAVLTAVLIALVTFVL